VRKWLGIDYLPWPIQVFWKLLCLAWAGILVGAAVDPSTGGGIPVTVLLCTFAAVGLLLFLFVRLGDG